MIETLPTAEEAQRRSAARAAGLPLSATWSEIWAKKGELPPALAIAAHDGAKREERDARQLEDAEQAEVVKLFRAWGGKVWTSSEKRKQKVTPGRPDLTVFFPARRTAVDWETKRPVGGRYSDGQLEYRKCALACGRLWGGGDLRDAEAWLIAQGWAERGPTGVLEPIRPR